MRAGTEKDFDIPSGGTQEQVALSVRLAFDRMLAKAGTAAFVVPDDAIVHTDNNRREKMFDAPTRRARDIQMGVYCRRQKAFRDLGRRGLDSVSAP